MNKNGLLTLSPVTSCLTSATAAFTMNLRYMYFGSGFCSTASDGLHPYPYNCSLYYNCWGGVGDPIKCLDGQYFSTVYNSCDYADRVKCNVEGSTSAPSTNAPTNAPTTQPPDTTAAPTQAPTTQGPETEAPAVTCDGNDGELMKHPMRLYQVHPMRTWRTCRNELPARPAFLGLHQYL